MTRHGRTYNSEAGVALIHMAVFLPMLLLFTGLAVDSGRAYIVKAQLSKAVDGAALSAARNLNGGNPKGEAAKVFNANFPPTFMGVTSVTDPGTAPDFYEMHTVEETGLHVVTIKATATVPTTFMRLGSLNEVTVSSASEATRRLVDLSLVLDVSGSIGPAWPFVRDAARSFIDSFDKNGDRMALITYSYGAKVLDPMPAGFGFDKDKLKADVPNALPGGTTSMPEGLYRGWDELRSVSLGQQAGLRVIVLFTDGSGNVLPGFLDASGIAKGVFSGDFPKVLPDPNNATTNTPSIQGAFQTETGAQSPVWLFTPPSWNSPNTSASFPYLPNSSAHTHHRSAGIPVSFALQSNSLKVNGVTQSTKRGLRNFNPMAPGGGKYPAEVFNIRNAVTNLTEIIADAARSDTTGDHKIRIFTIGMGGLVKMALGTIPETSESVLMRIANDKKSLDYDSAQLEGKYYFAQTAADLGPVFQQLQAQIIRLSK
jgi:Flp pilus assembly protein TadG